MFGARGHQRGKPVDHPFPPGCESAQTITAAITADAVKDLGLAEGSAVKALVKSTEVALATAPVENISIGNQIAGTVTEVATGGAMGSVKVTVEALGLASGTSVVALIKSTEISLSAA